ncbi:MAG: hypothetical protein AAGC74_14320 [Verrucomicrobiota bacterium]
MALLLLTSCLLEHEHPISPDPAIDPRLEGVWQFTPKEADEIRNERDEDDLGVGGYLIISRIDHPELEHDPRTYKVIAIDHTLTSRNSETTIFPEMFISTRRHNERNLLLVRLAPSELKKAKKEPHLMRSFKNWTIEYDFDEQGCLFLRFFIASDLEELMNRHPLDIHVSKEPFGPATIQNSEKELLEFYTDPKLLPFLTSLGKYRKLTPAN